MLDKIKIGFIGQGWIGKHYADDFETRGYETVRFALEEPFQKNKVEISTCPITFVAVPTPSTPAGFDDSILRDSLTNIGEGNIVVIKSTTLPGLVVKLQIEFPDIIILHSPEFLVEKTAAYDAAHPNRSIIGIPTETEAHRLAAEKVLAILPDAPYEAIMSSLESEILKYAGNCFLYTKVLFMNSLYDVVSQSGADFSVIREAMISDPRIGASHTDPIHSSGRGAGGHCFIKDFEAFRRYYEEVVGLDQGAEMLAKMVAYNNHLLQSTNKDLDLLAGVYGEKVISVDHL